MTEISVYFDGADEAKIAEEPDAESDLLKVEVVDEVKLSEAEEHDARLDEKGDAEEQEKSDEHGGELSVNMDRDSKCQFICNIR